MKRRLFRSLLLLIVLLGLVFTAPAAVAEDVNGALDLVILLDNSKSMYNDTKGRDKGHDVESFRYDAAAIMLNMCKSTGCRAVVYEFSGQYGSGVKPVGNTKTPESIDVDKTSLTLGTSWRGNLTKALTDRALETYKLKMDKGYNSPLGDALAMAVKQLDNCAEDRGDRQPLILVLADGDDNSPDSVRRQAVQECMDKGYKIYSFLLGEDFNHRDTLQELSILTKGSYFELEDPSELPNYFTQVLADQTGSELITEKIQPSKLGSNTWEIAIPLPNRSVQECNIMIPAVGLSNIKLSRPNGDPVISADEKVYYFEVGCTSSKRAESEPRFVQYKIMKPSADGSELGKWHLTFEADNEETAQGVYVTVIFNYDLTLKTDVAAPIEVGKNDTVTLQANFFTAEGAKSEDDMLYRSSEEDPAIVCTAYLVNDPVNYTPDPARSVTFKADQFSKNFRLDLKYNDIPGIQHRAGTFYIVVKAEGDGLIRAAEPIEYKIVNAAPEARKMTIAPLTIRNPIAGLDKQDECVFALTDCLADSDGLSDLNPDTITVKSGDEEIVLAKLENGSDVSTANIRLTTRGKAGTTTVTVTISDYEGTTATAEIPVQVDDLMQCLKDEYELIIAPVTTADADGLYQRGDAVELKATYQAKDPLNAHDIEQFKPTTEIWQIMDDGTRVTLEDGKAALEDGARDYRFAAGLYVNGHLLLTSEEKSLSSGNAAPKVNADVVLEPEAALIGCEKIPDTWLGHASTEPWVITFTDYFTDANEADKLTYTYSIEGEAAQVTEQLGSEGELVSLLITPQVEGTAAITLTATDDSSEKASASAVYTVKVVDHNKVTIKYCLLILAGLIALFILFKLIRAITRPKFRNVILQVFVNGIPQKEYPLDASIKKASLSRYTPSGHQFTPANAAGLEIRPHSDGMLVIVKNPAKIQGAAVSVGSTVLGKKVKKAVVKRSAGELSAVKNMETMSWKLVTGSGKPAAHHTPAAPKKPASRTSVPKMH